MGENNNIYGKYNFYLIFTNWLVTTYSQRKEMLAKNKYIKGLCILISDLYLHGDVSSKSVFLVQILLRSRIV